jgi:hypothetical protein
LQDFKGQALAERLYQIIILSFSVRPRRGTGPGRPAPVAPAAAAAARPPPVHSPPPLAPSGRFFITHTPHTMQLVGFVHGYIEQSFSLTVNWWLAGVAVAAVATVPGWPAVYQRHPVKWLDAVPKGAPKPAATQGDGGAGSGGACDAGGGGAGASAGGRRG